jgi:adenylate kinase family enzyme
MLGCPDTLVLLLMMYYDRIWQDNEVEPKSTCNLEWIVFFLSKRISCPPQSSVIYFIFSKFFLFDKIYFGIKDILWKEWKITLQRWVWSILLFRIIVYWQGKNDNEKVLLKTLSRNHHWPKRIVSLYKPISLMRAERKLMLKILSCWFCSIASAICIAWFVDEL